MFAHRITLFLTSLLLLLSCISIYSTQQHIAFADTSQNLNVSLTIPSTPQDYQFVFSSINNATQVHQDDTLTYQIVYGAKKTADQTTEIKLVADFTNDTAFGGELLDYVSESATNGYNNAIPVVDLIHKRITWNIHALPAGITDQIIMFQLHTNHNYTGSTQLPFSIIASMTQQADQTIAQTYKYHMAPLTSTVSLTLLPTQAIPSPTPSPLPTVTFSNIFLQSLTSQQLSLGVETNVPAKVTVLYGTSLGNLSQSVASLSYAISQMITLNNLSPQTTYYIKIAVTDHTGRIKNSDTYTFTTAAISEVPQVATNSIVFSSNDIVLSDATEDGGNPSIVMPKNFPYSFRFQLDKNATIKTIQAMLRNKYVLGISNTTMQDPNSQNENLIETRKGTFEGRLKTPPSAGVYQMFIRIVDQKGNITENPIIDVRVTQGLTVKDIENNQPIESAQVLLYYKKINSEQFEILPPEIFPIENPSYTDLYGQINIPLPQGTYKAKVTALGYKQKDVTFIIGSLSGEGYPTIQLQKDPFNLITMPTYYLTIANDTLQVTKLYIQNVSQSFRFFELNALVATAILVFLTLLSFAARIHIPLLSLIDYFLHIRKIRSVKKQQGKTVKGRIYDKETGDNLPSSVVFLINENKKSVIGYTISDEHGNFAFAIIPTMNYSLEVMKETYEPVIFHASEIQSVGLGGYLLGITKKQHTPSLKQTLLVFTEKIGAVCFETLLVLSFVFEISLGYALGFEKTIMFLCISGVNIILWLIHLTHLRSEKNIF